MGIKFNPTTGEFDFVGDSSGGYSFSVKDQILFDETRIATETLADAGTVHERITQIDYESSLYPTNILRQTITYNFTNLRYKIASINWAVL